MSNIHWLGNGLSSVPGIQRLANLDHPFTLWCRRTDAGKQLMDGCRWNSVRKLDWDDLETAVSPGDVVISMLPASEHIRVANICLDRSAHFVSSSYVSEEMSALYDAAQDQGLAFINEVGLDPGLDHLLAHDLIESFKDSELTDGDFQHHFRSYCGGFPSVPNDFKYKFSWSPVGVLKALKSPASWIHGGAVQHTDCPWKSLTSYNAPIASGEKFQAYPNRDSNPFVHQYHIPQSWKLSEFVRGTLRLEGWAEAWKDIFDTIDQLDPAQAEPVLKNMSNELWEKYSYQPGEADRVVLCVEHEVKDGETTVWHRSYSLDETGNDRGSAMARLVSLTVSLAVESVLNKELPSGVLAAVSDRRLVQKWLDQLKAMGETIEFTDHLE